METDTDTDTDTDTEMYVMLRGKKVIIKEIHTLESVILSRCYNWYDGEIPVKLKTRSLEKALEFCEKRGQLRKNHSPRASLDAFDSKFLKDVRKSGLNLVDLYHAAGRLGIYNLANPLFNDAFRILSDKTKTTPEQLEKIFKVRYNEKNVDNALCFKLIMEILNDARPCPALSKEQQEDVNRHREEIMKVPPADFTTLPAPRKLYWVYAHFIIKHNPTKFIENHHLSKEDADEEDDEEEESKQEEADEEEEESKQEEAEEEKSKVPKNDHDVGGPGPRGLAWKTTR